MLLDEPWLSTVLGRSHPHLKLVTPRPSVPVPAQAATAWREALGPRVDWGEALDVPSFYGREPELATLLHWVLEEGCRMVSVLGMGGIGKSALVTRAMHRLAEHFEVVVFRSLRNASSCDALLESCLQVLAPESLALGQEGLEGRLSRLLEELRRRRVLLVLDNLESLLSEGEVWGHLRPGFEAYGRLLRQVAQTAHPSCLLLTSREKPAELRALEGSQTPVRFLRLLGLDAAAGGQLLAEHQVRGSPEERAHLVQAYSGNPLALRIVAETIADLFGGEISPFLSAESAIFGGIAELLEEQWGRLSPLEQTVLCWLATLREPVTLEDLLSVLVTRLSPVQLLEAVDGLRRRSLIERGQRAGSFTLQSVVLEFVTGRLVTTARQEIQQGQLLRLREHGLSQAQAKEYVRQTQERLLLAPLLAHLQSVYRGQAEVEGRLRALLETLRGRGAEAQGYGPANLVALLRLLRGELRGLDLSRLTLRGVYLQGVELQDANLAFALIRESVFTGAFDATWAVAISGSGQYRAAGSKRGDMRVWREAGQSLYLAWQAHTDSVWALAFSPDERTLASGSFDGSVKLWEVASSALLWTGWHTNNTSSVAFSPDGSLLASGGNDATVRLWDPRSGRQLETLPHPAAVFALSWSPDGCLLASGDSEGTIRLWEMRKSGSATCMQTLSGHSNMVRGLAFAPGGSILASASWDGTVKLWEVGEARSLRMRQTLTGHTDKVQSLALSPDGGTLASGSYDHTIWLWDAQQGSARVALQGHSAWVMSLAFTPDSRSLLSGSEDGTLRVWDVESAQCVRVLQGYATFLYDVAWSPDGTKLASAGSDTLVALWEVTGATPPRLLRGHRSVVYGVGWSSDGSLLASSEWNSTIRLWDPTSGSCLQIMRDPDEADTLFFGLAWSPDGQRLACGTYRRGVQVWDVTARSGRWIGRLHPTWIRRVTWSPDSRRLVCGGDDGHVYVWDASDGTLLLRLAGHHGAIMSIAFSPDGSRLASGGGSQDSGELVVWDAHSGERMYTLEGLAGVVYTVAWHPVGDLLISGGSDGRLRWWNLQHGECVRVREAHQGTVQALKVSPDESLLASCGDDGAIALWDLHSGEPLRTLRHDRPYERLNITGIGGLTEAEIATLRALGAREDAPEKSIQPVPQA